MLDWKDDGRSAGGRLLSCAESRLGSRLRAPLDPAERGSELAFGLDKIRGEGSGGQGMAKAFRGGGPPGPPGRCGIPRLASGDTFSALGLVRPGNSAEGYRDL